jgi:hypothetical protein
MARSAIFARDPVEFFVFGALVGLLFGVGFVAAPVVIAQVVGGPTIWTRVAELFILVVSLNITLRQWRTVTPEKCRSAVRTGFAAGAVVGILFGTMIL